ncbi:MAG: 16S rRNA (guanine(527)-N(7))-methyltransferase RsmG [Saprospirales bacterium]|nr:MAG: 16S rRNA (guanine(527)-N(7))-methyltransferase RsmG [Saprospirales bacterium]
METIKQYFPDIDNQQLTKLELLKTELANWNEKINLISRKDVENIDIHHILHSLSIYKYQKFLPDSQVLDLGTGGGFPGLPLAIMQPEVNFMLIDARAKKIMVVKELIKALDLKNVNAVHIRAEEMKGQYDFVVSRAVAPLSQLMDWSKHLYSGSQYHGIPNGLICLKGGQQIKKELKQMPKSAYTEQIAIQKWFKDEWFEEKFVVYVQS